MAVNQIINISPQEIAKFNNMAAQWWDLNGPCKPLHQLNPVRLAYIIQHMGELEDKKILDIGCGGGILTESLASFGAHVTGIDMAPEAIEVAQLHWQGAPTLPAPHYILSSAEAYAELHPGEFDMITCMELLEHVPNPAILIKAITTLLKPQGQVCLSTLNRTPKAFLTAILGAEYVLRILPKGTHEYAKFIKPSELEKSLREAGLRLQDLTGMSYHPLTQEFNLSKNIEINYLAYATL